jgi:hypothetical protein
MGGCMMDIESPTYKNLISNIDIDRGIDSMQYINFRDFESEHLFEEFTNDISINNDTIELSIIRNKAYKEAVILSLSKNIDKIEALGMVRDEQKTFGGSKLFYLNDKLNKILVIAVPRNMEGKLTMVINRFNKVNEKVARLNSKIKKENVEIYNKRHSLKNKKDFFANMINEKLKV